MSSCNSSTVTRSMRNCQMKSSRCHHLAAMYSRKAPAMIHKPILPSVSNVAITSLIAPLNA